MNVIKDGMTYLLDLLYRFTSMSGWPTYGLAIILMTIIIKTLIFPLTWKQMASMRKTVELQPKIKEIQQKFKNDPQKANAAIMEFYKENNMNPMGGCLPLVIQLPIFWGLYSALQVKAHSFTVAQAHFLWFNLSAPDHTLVLPILAGLTTYLQTRLTNPNASTDPTQKMMLYFMPLMFAWISYSVLSGLALYWVTMNIVSIFQQLFINRQLEKEKAKTV